MSRVVHSKSGTKTYQTWNGMIQRCTNPKSSGYSNYGARGISVCKRWMESFENFYKDMGERPEGKTLDRINNNGNYNKKNCRWASNLEQAWNRRNTIRIGDVYNTYEVIRIDYENKKVVSRCQKCGEIFISSAWTTTVRADCRNCWSMETIEFIELAKTNYA